MKRPASNLTPPRPPRCCLSRRILTAPLDVRQSHLESNFGFKCACGRCKVEQQQPSTTRDQLTELYDEVQALEEPVLEAIGVEDWRLLQELQQELLDVQDRCVLLHGSGRVQAACTCRVACILVSRCWVHTSLLRKHALCCTDCI